MGCVGEGFAPPAGDRKGRPYGRKRGAVGRADVGIGPYGICKECLRTGRRGNRRSAASGGRSEPISRKCPDWRVRQWPSVGWHDGGQPPAPTEGYKGRGRTGGVEPRPYGWVASRAAEWATARVAPTGCNMGCGGAGRCGHRPLRKRSKNFGKRAAEDMQEGAFLWIFGQKNTRFKSGINLTILRWR